MSVVSAGVELAEVEALMTAIRERYGYDFSHYARASFMRRVRHARHPHGARPQRINAEDKTSRLGPAGTQQSGETDDLAPANIERHVLNALPRREVLCGKDDLPALAPAPREGRRMSRSSADVTSEH